MLEQDQHELLFVTLCGSHRELVADCQFNPTGSKDLPAPELAHDGAPRGAGLRLIWS